MTPKESSAPVENSKLELVATAENSICLYGTFPRVLNFDWCHSQSSRRDVHLKYFKVPCGVPDLSRQKSQMNKASRKKLRFQNAAKALHLSQTLALESVLCSLVCFYI